MSTMIQYVLYLAILVVLAIPLGAYIKNVMSGEKTFLSKVLTPCENLIYKVMRVDREEQMTWKKYAVSVMIFSGIGLVFLFLLQLLQGVLPGNPQHLSGVKWDLAFNTSASFITNTNWQAYSGESTLSYLTQALGLTVQNFVSAATGIAVLFALIRGFIKVKSSGLGSFWVDLTRIVVHILLPLNLVISLLLVGGGVIQNLKSAETVSLVEPIAVSAEGEILEDAVIDLDTETVTVDGEIVSDAQIVTEQFVPMGPAASQVAIKQTGTNGGGYMGVNSAHPLENPNAFTNLIEMISILLIPAALCFTFGSAVKNKKQGIAIFMAMFLCLVVALGCIAVTEQAGTSQLAQNGAVNMSMAEQAGGNMEGKETRFGIAASSTWAAFTTAASNGSVNSMHDSYTPLAGMVTMLLMQLGEVIFGGVGCGLYGMLAFAILAVFIAGLMVGRTPEFLGKKIEPYEMKWSVLVCLATPIAILVGSGLAAVVPSVMDSLHNGGAHGFSEMLYAYSSCGGNNGSAFAGFNANTVFLNVSLGLMMLFARFLPIQGHRVLIIAVLTKPAEDVPHILGSNTLDDFQISRRNVCCAGDQHLVNDGIVDFPLCFLHKRLPDSKRTLVSPEFLGEHLALLRLVVDHIQGVHRAVADVGNQVHAFKSRCEARNGGVALRIDAHIVDIDMVSGLFVDKFHLGVLHQICSKICLLPACPGQRQTGGNHNVRLGKIFGFQLLGDCRKGQHIIVLILDLVWCKFLVPLAGEIIPAVVDQHICCKQRFVVIGGDAGGKAEIGRFHIPVPVVNADDFCVVDRFHFLILLIYSDL